jgi:hypothetical protein
VIQYRQGTYTNDQGDLVSNRYQFYSFTNYKNITLESDQTLDEISLKYYGTPLYYWLIGEANNVEDPFSKLLKGTAIKVPEL